MKKCNRCLEEKSKNLFFDNPSSPDGKKSICKSCCRITVRAYEINNKEKVRALHRKNRDARKEHYRLLEASAQRRRRKIYPWEQHFYMARNNRIDPSKDYEITNCRFIELSMNSKLAATRRKSNRLKVWNEIS